MREKQRQTGGLVVEKREWEIEKGKSGRDKTKKKNEYQRTTRGRRRMGEG